MKEATPQHGLRATMAQGTSRRSSKQLIARCSICTCRIWFNPLSFTEAAGVPEPRLSWVLCKGCHRALLAEMRRSPLQSPLSLRIAVGMVAAERWPQAYPTKVKMYITDRKWIVWIAVLFIVAMLLHLALIVTISTISP